MNSKDRKELQEVVDARIAEKISELSLTRQNIVTLDMVLSDLDIEDEYTELLESETAYTKAYDRLSNARENLARRLEANDIDTKYHGTSVEWLKRYLKDQVIKRNDEIFKSSALYQKIQDLKKQARDIKTQLLFVDVSSEVKAIFEQLEEMLRN